MGRNTTAINRIFRKIVRRLESNDIMAEACLDNLKILGLIQVLGPRVYQIKSMNLRVLSIK